MKNLTNAGAAQTLVSHYKSGDLVDSHQFQRDAMTHCLAAFSLDFVGYIDQSDPLRPFSRDFGQWLDRELCASGHIKRHSRVKSANLRGDNTENQLWEIP